ncbi:hypothetical protein [Shewanella jiangmenensis]|uniref:hypothetical protein n=1 Tax=Shewanella jiangmenensis TaxID=2837387 RepID=UPI001BDF2A03|nr:hypothetical protein [Shewanella jiangmenensis]
MANKLKLFYQRSAFRLPLSIALYQTACSAGQTGAFVRTFPKHLNSSIFAKNG